ncbi:MAG: hypothetical protein ACTHMS_15905 [Jatrophihabitans sp.]|uniref:hypothetical protein n=1 Tax=Jatrophihabitans sp. TaxID=1932789 RepID=UPI003F7EEC2C
MISDGRIPSLALVHLGLETVDDGQGRLVAELVRADRAELTEPPRVDRVRLLTGEQATWVVHYRHGVTAGAGPDPDSVSISVHLVWTLRPGLEAWLTSVSPELRRTVALHDDLVALAAAVRMIPVTPS